MAWKERALALLKDSLEPVPSELNEIDWKSGLSDKSDRLAQHISAFANHLYGGMLVYGVNDDGTIFSLGQDQIDEIAKKLGNIASNNLSHKITDRAYRTKVQWRELAVCLYPRRTGETRSSARQGHLRVILPFRRSDFENVGQTGTNDDCEVYGYFLRGKHRT